jgi:hypothetical protein
MDILTPSDHKTLLINLASLWQTARQDAANLISEAEAKAHALENEAATALNNAIHSAENAFLCVKHDIETGIVRVFQLVEIDPTEPTQPK